jgi:hypothetical protein
MKNVDGDEKTGLAVLASRDDLARIKLEEVLHGVDRADDLALERALRAAANGAEAQGESQAQRAYNLLSTLFPSRCE